jgi:hypothetical protein
MEVDIALLCEHKLNTNLDKVKAKMYEGARQVYGMGEFHLTLGSTKATSVGFAKPGGTLVALIGPTKGRMQTTGADDMGRWTYVKLLRTDKPTLTIICTYQVVDVDPTTTGSQTYAMQLYQRYYTEQRPEPKQLRKHHSDDLVSFVKQCQNQGESVIVVGDLNETLGETPGGMSRLCGECNLCDIVADRHASPAFSTHQQGSAVIDYILMDPERRDSVSQCGHEPFNINILSDHRGVYVNFSTSALFGNTHRALLPMELRDISTKRIHQTAPYFEFKDKHLSDHKWYKGIDELQDAVDSDTPNHDFAEKLYKRLCSSCQFAGSRLKRYPGAPYSPELSRMRTIQRLLQLTISQYTSKYDLTTEIEETSIKLSSFGYTLPNTLADCWAALSQQIKEIKKTTREEDKSRKLRNQHLEKLIEAHDQNGNKKEANNARQIKKAEQVKRVFQKLRAIRGLMTSGGLSHVLVPVDPNENPKTCTEWRREDNPQALEKLLEDPNKQHFGQSQNCTLTSPPLNFTNEFHGTCDRGKAILKGTFLDEFDQSTQTTETLHDTDDSSTEVPDQCSRNDDSDDEDDDIPPPANVPFVTPRILFHHLPPLLPQPQTTKHRPTTTLLGTLLALQRSTSSHEHSSTAYSTSPSQTKCRPL